MLKMSNLLKLLILLLFFTYTCGDNSGDNSGDYSSESANNEFSSLPAPGPLMPVDSHINISAPTDDESIVTVFGTSGCCFEDGIVEDTTVLVTNINTGDTTEALITSGSEILFKAYIHAIPEDAISIQFIIDETPGPSISKSVPYIYLFDIRPEQAHPGDRIILHGNGLSHNLHENIVYFDSIPVLPERFIEDCSSFLMGGRYMQVVVPESASTGLVTVARNNKTSNGILFKEGDIPPGDHSCNQE